MKIIINILIILLPSIASSQVVLKAGAAVGMRWNETLNSQTLGRGTRLSAEKYITQQFTIGAEVSYFIFKPNNLVSIHFNSYNLLVAYYFNTKRLQPYAGFGMGYTKYQDKTTIDLGGGISSKQTRNKDYGNISAFLGLKYGLAKEKRSAFFIQANTDFIPIVNIDPIGFVSVAAGFSYRL